MVSRQCSWPYETGWFWEYPEDYKGPRDGDFKTPYAVVQLRQDNAAGSLYNIVGFQTHLNGGEQKRVFQMIPGLENAEFVRYGVMHRNSYMDSPNLLKQTFQSKSNPNLFFAGQMTGVEGYVESAALRFGCRHQCCPSL